jgi:methionine sulfoxide reductase heme-binding subunit
MSTTDLSPAIRSSGWRLFTVLAGLPIVVAIAIALQHPNLDGTRQIVILSVRYSLFLFCLAFTASALQTLWPTAQSRWLLANRRYIGLSFAVAHSVHIIALIVYATVWPEVYVTKARILSEILGVIGYAFVLAMAVTSFKATKKWLTPQRWRTLHKIGGYCIWAVFVYMFVRRFMARPTEPIFSVGLVLLLSTVLLRVQAYRLTRKRVAVS